MPTGGSYACSYCNHTLYPQAAGEFCGHFNEMASRFSQIPAATGYLLICFLFVLFFPACAGPLRAACTSMTLLVPRDCRPKGRSPSFARVPVPYSSAEGNDPAVGRGVPQAVFYVRVVSCRCTCSRITNTRVTGYRTLAALASDSPPRASVIASRVPRPGAPRPAETGRDRPGAPRVPATKTRQPSPAPGSLRRSSHFGSRSAPSRAALLAWLMAASSWAFPLDRALCGRPAASVAERSSGTGRHY